MKRSLSIAAITLAALLLAGCSSGSDTAQQSSGSIAHDGSAPVLGYRIEGGAELGSAPLAPEALGDRAVITTGSVSITSTDPIAAATEATKLVSSADGRVDSRSEQPATDTFPARASLVIRVPAEQLDGVLDKIKQLGTVNSVSLNASDVTQQKQDISARITALQTSVDRLLDLMSKAADTADLIAIESALSSRQAELDSLITQRDYLDDQIDYSTIDVEFVSEGTVAPGSPDSFWDGIVAGWNSLVAFLAGFVVVLGVLIPWLALLGVLAAIVVAIIVRVRRRRRTAEPGANTEETVDAVVAEPGRHPQA